MLLAAIAAGEGFQSGCDLKGIDWRVMPGSRHDRGGQIRLQRHPELGGGFRLHFVQRHTRVQFNQRQADPECNLDFVPNKGRAACVPAALCNCLGFGSKNSALVIGADR